MLSDVRKSGTAKSDDMQFIFKPMSDDEKEDTAAKAKKESLILDDKEFDNLERLSYVVDDSPVFNKLK